MNIGRAIENLDALPAHKLRHLRGLVGADLESYKHCARNYPPERWKRHAIPFIAEREEWLRRIDAQMAAYGLPPYGINQLAQGMQHLRDRYFHERTNPAPDRSPE